MTFTRQIPPHLTLDGPGMIACPECDLLQQEIDLPRHSSAHCLRCRALLYRGSHVSLDGLLAFTLGSAILLVVSHLFPIAVLTAQGTSNVTTLTGMVLALYQQGDPFSAVLVLATTILIPALELLALLYMLVPLRAGFVPAGLALAFRFLIAAHPWSMMEVLLLGALITLIKLADLATVIPGISLWSFIGLIGFFSVISASFSVRDFWHWVETAGASRQMPETV